MNIQDKLLKTLIEKTNSLEIYWVNPHHRIYITYFRGLYIIYYVDKIDLEGNGYQLYVAHLESETDNRFFIPKKEKDLEKAIIKSLDSHDFVEFEENKEKLENILEQLLN